MTDDVRAAAERLRQFKAGRSCLDVYDAKTVDKGFAKVVYDEGVLAQAWLDAFPADDGETLTPERLAAFGFTEVENQWGGLALRVNGRLRFRHDSTAPANEQWAAFDAVGGDGIYVPDPQTVGGLRRLCAALGIPITETPK